MALNEFGMFKVGPVVDSYGTVSKTSGFFWRPVSFSKITVPIGNTRMLSQNMDRPWLPGASGATLPASDTVNRRQCLGVTSRRWEDRQVASIALVTPATATQACVATLAKCLILSPVCCLAYFLINFSSFRSLFFLSCKYFFFFILPASLFFHHSPLFPSVVFYLFACTYLFIAILFSVTVLSFLPTCFLFPF